jgi:hypothetical protein
MQSNVRNRLVKQNQQQILFLVPNAGSTASMISIVLLILGISFMFILDYIFVLKPLYLFTIV